MKFLRKQLDRMKPHFHEGGRLSRFRSVFEGFETFMFVPDAVPPKGLTYRDHIDLKRSMMVVIIALTAGSAFRSIQHWSAAFQGLRSGIIGSRWLGTAALLVWYNQGSASYNSKLWCGPRYRVFHCTGKRA
jgi:hypothetical protein